MHFEFSLEDNFMNRLTPFIKQLKSSGIKITETFFTEKNDTNPSVNYQFNTHDYIFSLHVAKNYTSLWISDYWYNWTWAANISGVELNFHTDGSRSLVFDHSVEIKDYVPIPLKKITWGGE